MKWDSQCAMDQRIRNVTRTTFLDGVNFNLRRVLGRQMRSQKPVQKGRENSVQNAGEESSWNPARRT